MFRVILLLVSLFGLSFATRTCPAVQTCLSALDAGKQCPLLPVPGRTPSVSLSPQGFNLTELRPGVYWYSDNFYQSLILYKGDRLAVVDFPKSTASIAADGTYLLTTATLDVLDGEKPRRVDMIYGHRHTDHIGRAGTYKKFVTKTFPEAKILVWSTLETKNFLRRIPHNDVPLPNVIVGKRGSTIDVAPGIDLRLFVLGGHTNEDLVAHVVPSSDGHGVVHYVDVLWPGGAPFLNFAVTIDLGRYISAQEELLHFEFKYLSAGHGPLGTRQDVRRNIAYTKFVIQAAVDAAREVDARKIQAVFDRIADPNDPAFGNTQWSFIETFNIQAGLCERKVIERWGCELYGTDSVAKSHCLSALIYNFIDQ